MRRRKKRIPNMQSLRAVSPGFELWARGPAYRIQPAHVFSGRVNRVAQCGLY